MSINRIITDSNSASPAVAASAVAASDDSAPNVSASAVPSSDVPSCLSAELWFSIDYSLNMDPNASCLDAMRNVITLHKTHNPPLDLHDICCKVLEYGERAIRDFSDDDHEFFHAYYILIEYLIELGAREEVKHFFMEIYHKSAKYMFLAPDRHFKLIIENDYKEVIDEVVKLDNAHYNYETIFDVAWKHGYTSIVEHLVRTQSVKGVIIMSTKAMEYGNVDYINRVLDNYSKSERKEAAEDEDVQHYVDFIKTAFTYGHHKVVDRAATLDRFLLKVASVYGLEHNRPDFALAYLEDHYPNAKKQMCTDTGLFDKIIKKAAYNRHYSVIAKVLQIADRVKSEEEVQKSTNILYAPFTAYYGIYLRTLLWAMIKKDDPKIFDIAIKPLRKEYEWPNIVKLLRENNCTNIRDHIIKLKNENKRI